MAGSNESVVRVTELAPAGAVPDDDAAGAERSVHAKLHGKGADTENEIRSPKSLV